jgi:uncharacterized protein YbbC (DUF1343 family)
MTGQFSRRGLLAGGLTVTAGGVLAAATATPATATDHGRLMLGVEVLAADGYRALAGQRVGLLGNPTSVLPDLRHVVDVLHADPRVDLVAAFGPEHGFRGTAQAGGSEGSYPDPKTGVQVYDLYAKTWQRIAETFTASGVDTVVFDIQDVGARFYTYVWTMYSAMKAAASVGKRFVVLDRPNPVTGTACRGPVLHPEYASGVGLEPIAQQHGMTVGELARLFNADFVPAEVGRPVELTVVGMRGWRREQSYADTGLPWVLPSPNMPTPDTARVYPGFCLFEATNLSEGRGTTRPFEMVGAPYVKDRVILAEELTALHLPGAAFRENYFAPTFSKWVGQTCGGVQVYVTDPRRFDAIRTAIAVIATVKRLYPADFAWRESTAPFWIDTLSGSDRLRHQLDAGASLDDIVAGWQPELAAFTARRARHLLYR